MIYHVVTLGYVHCVKPSVGNAKPLVPDEIHKYIQSSLGVTSSLDGTGAEARLHT